jgi:hypothetical protein
MFLRSSQLEAQPTGLAARIGKQLESEVASLGFKKTRPLTLPTVKVCTSYDALRTNIVTMIQLQKYVLSLEDQVRQQNRANKPPSKKQRR